MTSNGEGSNSLANYIDQLEQLDEDRRAIARAKRKLLDDAADHGLRPNALRDVIKRRHQTPAQAEEQRQDQLATDPYLEQLNTLLAEAAPEKATKAHRARA